MFYSSARGQTEPIAALFAVLIVAAGLALYAGVVDEALGGSPDREVTSATLERVEAHMTPNGVVRPARTQTIAPVLPDGYRTNVTLTAGEDRWAVGPPVVPNATAASRTVSVRTGPATVERGTLQVVTWK